MTHTKRNIDDDGESLLQFIEQGAGRTGKSVEIPSPEGRAQAGWVAIQSLKVQPEVNTMLEQLREHPLFRGKWKTNSQVAWSMIYLGLQSCYQFYQKSDGWKDYKSNFMALMHANQEHENHRKQEQLVQATRKWRSLIHTYLNKGTAFGKYKAWVTLEQAIRTRDMVEDIKTFDQNMRMPGAPVLDSTLVFDNRAGEMWEKMFPVLMGPINDTAADELYVTLTQEHFDELDKANAQPDHD